MARPRPQGRERRRKGSDNDEQGARESAVSSAMRALHEEEQVMVGRAAQRREADARLCGVNGVRLHCLQRICGESALYLKWCTLLMGLSFS